MFIGLNGAWDGLIYKQKMKGASFN